MSFTPAESDHFEDIKSNKKSIAVQGNTELLGSLLCLSDRRDAISLLGLNAKLPQNFLGLVLVNAEESDHNNTMRVRDQIKVKSISALPFC